MQSGHASRTETLSSPICDSVSKAGVCVSWGKIALHSMHHDISSAAGSLISRKAVGQLRVHNSKFGACAVMSIRTLHHAIFNCRIHREDISEPAAAIVRITPMGRFFICFYTSIKQVFHSNHWQFRNRFP